MRILSGLGMTLWATIAAAGRIGSPVSAPTLDEIGLIALVVIMGVVGGMIARRKK